MQKLLLSFAAASAIAVVAAVAPAGAMTVGTASGIKAAAADAGIVDQVVYVCRHRYWSSRRFCYWRPGGYRGWRWRHRW